MKLQVKKVFRGAILLIGDITGKLEPVMDHEGKPAIYADTTEAASAGVRLQNVKMKQLQKLEFSET